MVVVTFLVEFNDNNVVTVPVGISDARGGVHHPQHKTPLKDFLARLRDKCGIGAAPLEVRNKDASRVDVAAWSADTSPYLMVIVDEPASDKALQYRETMRRTIRTNSMIGEAPASSAPPPKATLGEVATLGGPQQSKAAASARAAAAPAAPQQAATDSEDDDEYDVRGGDHIDAPDAVHFVAHGGTNTSTAVSKVAGDYGAILCQEQPQLSPMYASSLVDVVRRDPRLKVWPRLIDYYGNKGIERLESALPGVSKEDFSRLLYVAKRRGHTLPAAKDEEVQVAFYSYIDSIPHSCAPSALLRFRRQKSRRGVERTAAAAAVSDDVPSDCGSAGAAAASGAGADEAPAGDAAILRCIRWEGLTAGEKLTVALPRVAHMDFFVLPTPRRRRLLQEQYGFADQCVCERCTNRLSPAANQVEDSLTGAFFTGRAMSTREHARIVQAMKAEFDRLRILARTSVHAEEPMALSKDARAGKISAETVKALYDFLLKYTRGVHVPETMPAAAATASKDDGAAEPDGGNAKADRQDDDDDDSSAAAAMKLHPFHWRLSLCRIALLAYLFPPEHKLSEAQLETMNTAAAAVGGAAGARPAVWHRGAAAAAKLAAAGPVTLPVRHPSVRLDLVVVQHALTQLDVESAVLAEFGGSAHPALARSYIVFRHILAALPERLSSSVQRQARNLAHVNWPLIEHVAMVAV